MHSRYTQLAIHGGAPVRTAKYPPWPQVGNSEIQRISDVVLSGNWSRRTGHQLDEFERRFAEYHNCEFAIAVANGTAALKVALLACDLGRQAEVLVPAYSFLATASAVVECNARPVFVDVCLDTFNISVPAIEAAITENTKAIVVVHFGGLPADIQVICEIARSRNLYVIEDAAQAHGAEHNGQRVGSFGDFGCFSFQASKILTCGEGGIVVTRDRSRAKSCREISDWGSRLEDGQFHQEYVCSNYRLSELQGGILNAQLDRFNMQANCRTCNAAQLLSKLSRIPGISPQLRKSACTRHAYSVVGMRISEDTFGMERTKLVAALIAEGIPAHIGYDRPIYMQPMYSQHCYTPFCDNGGSSSSANPVYCPNSELLCYKQSVWLDQRVLIGDEKDAEDVVTAFRKIHDFSKR